MEIKKFITGQIIKAKILKEKAVKKFRDKSGMSTTSEILLWVAGSAVLAAIIIGLIILFINSEWFPGFKKVMTDIFNMK